jgi:hypothetical protein
MDEERIRQCLEAVARFELSDDVRAQDLKRVEQRLMKYTRLHERERRGILRTVMTSSIAKVAAAVIVIVAIFVLRDGEVDIASSVYAQMRENMQGMPWVHLTVTGTYEGKDTEVEQWCSDRAQVIAMKKPDGELEFSDYKNGKKYVYDPNARLISLLFIDKNDYPEAAISLQDGIDSILSMLNQQGATINHHVGEFDRKEVEIYEIQYQVDKMGIEGKIYVNLKSRLPMYGEYRASDADGNQANAQMHFEFPEVGPENIYDIGAPVTAKAPSQDLQDIFDIYRSCRQNSPQRYIAIITEEYWNGQIRYVDVVYKDGKTQRKERISTDDFKQQWVEYSRQKDVPFVELLELARKGGSEHNSISLYVDGKLYWLFGKKNGPWKISEQRSSVPNSLARDDLAGLGWPLYSNMQNEVTLIENEYSRENSLICIQQLHQGQKMPRGHPDTVHKPSKYLYYLNPRRDYICECIEYHSIMNAPWQKDDSWLDGVDPDELHRDTICITEVTDYRQTKNGSWYPWKIEFRISPYDAEIGEFKPFSLNNVKTVYLNTEPIFPEGIFDPNNLPREGE